MERYFGTVINVSCFRRRTCLVLVWAWAVAVPSDAQVRDTIYQLPLKALDLTVTSTSKVGVMLAASPNVYSSQGDKSWIWMYFYPDSVRAWLDHAVVVLRSPLVSSPVEQVQWSRRLRGLENSGALLLGRSIKDGKLRNRYWMSVGDTTDSYYFEIERQEADSLMQLMLTASGESVYSRDTTSYTEDEVDTPAQVVRQRLEVDDNTIPGRALVSYTVGVDGKAEAEGIHFLFLSHRGMEEPVRRAVLNSLFKPALRNGKPVRQHVVQPITIRPSRRPR